MEHLAKQYIELLSSPGLASNHFWKLEKRIKEDKKSPGVQLEMRKSKATWDIAIYVRKNVIQLDDLEGFSDELISAVKIILDR